MGTTRLVLGDAPLSKCSDIGVMGCGRAKRTPRLGGMRHGVSSDQGFAVDSPGA
jgi:hypothetical protein